MAPTNATRRCSNRVGRTEASPTELPKGQLRSGSRVRIGMPDAQCKRANAKEAI